MARRSELRTIANATPEVFDASFEDEEDGEDYFIISLPHGSMVSGEVSRDEDGVTTTELCSLDVPRRHRGNGIGKRLVETFLPT